MKKIIKIMKIMKKIMKKIIKIMKIMKKINKDRFYKVDKTN